MKKIYFITLLAIVSFSLQGQIEEQIWVKYEGNPVVSPGESGEWDEGVVASGSVIFHNDTFRLWYSSTHIGYATSTDGFNWTKYEGNPVMLTGEGGSWDDYLLNEPKVVFHDNVYHMWYGGHPGGDVSAFWKIGHATSPDGINWTRDPNNPVLDKGPDGTWDDVWIAPGSALHDGSKFHLWYAGWNGIDDHLVTGHATSMDGTEWTKDTLNPVMKAGTTWDKPRCNPGAMLFDGSGFHSWYLGGALFDHRIGYATSEDGSDWVKNDEPVMDVGESGEWDEGHVAAMTVMYDSTLRKFKMWYSGGVQLEGMAIGYAETPPDGIEDFSPGRFSIFPNPTGDIFTLDLAIPVTGALEIFNLNGQLIYQEELEGATHEIDMSAFSRGIYIVMVRSDGFVRTEKVVKL